jgi:hypothetical protein
MHDSSLARRKWLSVLSVLPGYRDHISRIAEELKTTCVNALMYLRAMLRQCACARG